MAKKMMVAPEKTLIRLRQLQQLVNDEKDLQEHIREKHAKNVLKNEGEFATKSEERPDPKDPKGGAKITVTLPTWNNNIDRVLLHLA